MSKKISIIIPTFNRAHFIGEAIQSALEQEILEAEIIVVDDGSTDGTREVVSNYAERFPLGFIKYLYQENAGPANARNRTLDMVSLAEALFALGEFEECRKVAAQATSQIDQLASNRLTRRLTELNQHIATGPELRAAFPRPAGKPNPA